MPPFLCLRSDYPFLCLFSGLCILCNGQAQLSIRVLEALNKLPKLDQLLMYLGRARAPDAGLRAPHQFILLSQNGCGSLFV